MTRAPDSEGAVGEVANPPAFPTEWSFGLEPDEPMQTGAHTAQFPGMSLRDWFATHAPYRIAPLTHPTQADTVMS